MTIVKCDICGVDNMNDREKCDCCGWPFSSVLIMADRKQVSELCKNVFQYSHKLFVEQLGHNKAL